SCQAAAVTFANCAVALTVDAWECGSRNTSVLKPGECGSEQTAVVNCVTAASPRCVSVNGDCSAGPCCNGATCITPATNPTSSVCAANCLQNSDCVSGCCTKL